MSLTKLVADLIAARNAETTVDSLMTECNGYSREQVSQALHNAKHRGLIAMVRRGRSGSRYSTGELNTYGPAQDEPKPQQGRPVSFVFDLGRC